MRIYVLLIITAIILSFSTAFFAVNLSQKEVATKEDLLVIGKIKKEFRQAYKTKMMIDLSAMYPSQSFFALLHPLNVFQKTSNLKNTFFSKPCLRSEEKMSQLTSLKSELWEDFRCNRIKNVPDTFFEKLPLIHESGVSYAYLAFLSGKEPFNNVEWVKGKLNFFHISELSELPISALEKNFSLLSQLSALDIERIVKGEEFLVTDEYIIYVGHGEYPKSKNGVVSLYSRNDFELFLKSFNYRLKKLSTTKPCFIKEGTFCFDRDDNSLEALFRQSSIFVFLGSLFILFLISVVLYNKIKFQKVEEERKKHALRVLTHELRTPLANLILQIESINKNSEELSPTMLEDFLKIESDVYRLKRLTEKSSTYLQTFDGNGLISLKNEKFGSLNELHEKMLEPYFDQGVEFVNLKQDQAFILDLYWWNMCLKNIVENALVHGKLPIKIELMMKKDLLLCKVFDSGEQTYSSLEELMKSKHSHASQSLGLGMGLSIVKKIIKEMGGDLLYQKSPKCLILQLPQGKK